MRLPSYTRSDRVLRSRMAARRVPRAVRFCVAFFGLFAGACFFWGGDMLAYAQEGSFLMLGLTLLVCGIFAAGACSTFSGKRVSFVSSDQQYADRQRDADYLCNPNSIGYLYEPKK